MEQEKNPEELISKISSYVRKLGEVAHYNFMNCKTISLSVEKAVHEGRTDMIKAYEACHGYIWVVEIPIIYASIQGKQEFFQRLQMIAKKTLGNQETKLSEEMILLEEILRTKNTRDDFVYAIIKECLFFMGKVMTPLGY